jgi:hypothetical protein
VRFDSILKLRETRQQSAPSEPALTKANEAALSDYQVIEHFHIEQFTSLHDLARHQHILNIYMENHLTV